MPRIALNAPAPDFELADYNGGPVRLSGFRGRNVLLVFNRGFV
jgi:peroxiredoxin